MTSVYAVRTIYHDRESLRVTSWIRCIRKKKLYKIKYYAVATREKFAWLSWGATRTLRIQKFFFEGDGDIRDVRCISKEKLHGTNNNLSLAFGPMIWRTCHKLLG